jgi:hypothetical protein
MDWLLSSLWIIFSCFFLLPSDFGLMPAIVDFNLLGSGHFFCYMNILEIYSEMQSILLGKAWSFYYDDRLRTLLSLGLIISHYWGKTFLSVLPCVLWNVSFSSLAVENRPGSQLSISTRHCSPILLSSFFLYHRVFSFHSSLFTSWLNTQCWPFANT